MVRRSRERVEVGDLPAGYGLRAFRDGDERAYGELFRLAWPDEGTLPYTRAHALHDGLLVVEDESSRQLVGSCVAFAPETAAHGDNGSLGWLVVDPAHGGRGLGTLLAATVTNRLLDEQYALPWLGTEDDRLAALRIYLALGWEPHLYADGMEARWREIFKRLDLTPGPFPEGKGS
jgi:mycothiol synthase